MRRDPPRSAVKFRTTKGFTTGDRAEVVAALVRHKVKEGLVAGIVDRPATDAQKLLKIRAPISLSYR
jgi:hypothetical protein